MHIEMATLEKSIDNLLAKRRLEGGEFCYVQLVSDKTVSGKKAAMGLLQEDEECYKKLMETYKLPEETDDSFNSRVMKLVQNVSFENVSSLKSSENEHQNKATYSNFVKSSSPVESQNQITQSEGFILPPKKSSPPQNTKKLLQEPQVVNAPIVELTPFEKEIEKFKSCHEPKHQWELKKRFMMAHRDSFHLMELVGLAQTFGNIEFLGCTYPQDTMRQVRLTKSLMVNI